MAKTWVEEIRSRGGDPEKIFTALIVSLAVVNKTNGEPLYLATYFLDYYPAKIARGDAELIYTLHIVKDRGEKRGLVFKVERSERKAPLGAILAAFQPPYVEPPPNLYCVIIPSDIPTYMCWQRKVWIGIDNLTKVFPASYFAVKGGKIYMKIPVIMAVNNFTYSGSVNIGIDMSTTSAQFAVYAALVVPEKGGYPSHSPAQAGADNNTSWVIVYF